MWIATVGNEGNRNALTPSRRTVDLTAGLVNRVSWFDECFSPVRWSSMLVRCCYRPYLRILMISGLRFALNDYPLCFNSSALNGDFLLFSILLSFTLTQQSSSPMTP